MGINSDMSAKAVETKRRRYGEDALAKWGAKGGRAKVLKGMAWVKINDPERFARIIKERKYKP